MNIDVKSFDGPVILLGGGDVNWPVFENYRGQGWPVIAVDGGANALVERDIAPELIIGDLDSITMQEYWKDKSKLVQIAEQDTTDFEKCLYSTNAPLYVGLGFLGQRFDHSLAALHVIAKYCESKSVLLVDGIDALFVTNKTVSIQLPTGSRVSVFPLAPVTFEASSGLEFPLDGLTLDIGARTGTSNRSCEEQIRIEPAKGQAGPYAVITDNIHHPAMLAALT